MFEPPETFQLKINLRRETEHLWENVAPLEAVGGGSAQTDFPCLLQESSWRKYGSQVFFNLFLPSYITWWLKSDFVEAQLLKSCEKQLLLSVVSSIYRFFFPVMMMNPGWETKGD